MRKMEAKKYFTNKGVEVYEYGYEFDFAKDFKVGDKVMVYGSGWSMSNDEYPDKNRFYFGIITKIDVERGIITLSNGLNYKQAVETTYLYKGYKEVECLEYFKTTKDPDVYIKETCYDFSYKTIKENNIRPRYFYIYTEEKQKQIKEFIENVKILDIERKEKELEKQRKQDIYNKYQTMYNEEIDPLVKRLEELKQQISEQKSKTFDKVFCANCKSNGKYKCAYERYWHGNDYIDENHMYEYDGEKYRSRPITKCEYFEEKDGK